MLAGLVANNVYQNIYFGKNLKSIPDLTTQNWWYRGEFTAPATAPGQAYWLRFKGISYRAQIWLNGTQLDANAVGTMAAHEYNVTSLINRSAAERPCDPRHSAGARLQRSLLLHRRLEPGGARHERGALGCDAAWIRPDRLRSRDPYVKTVLPLPATNCADLTVYVDAVNATNAPATTTISGNDHQGRLSDDLGQPDRDAQRERAPGDRLRPRRLSAASCLEPGALVAVSVRQP